MGLSDRLAERRFRYTVIVFLSFPAALMAYYAGSLVANLGTRPPAPERPLAAPSVLFLDPESLNLGEVWEDPAHVVALVVENRSPVEVKVERFVTSCECTRIEPQVLVIPPGQGRSVRATFDMTHRLPYQRGVDTREFAVTIQPVVAGVAVTGWELRGRVKSILTLDTALVQFGEKCYSGGPVQERRVRATARIPIAGIEAMVDPAKARAAVVPAAEAGRYEIVINPNPLMPVGRFDFHVDLAVRLPDGTRRLCERIAVEGEQMPCAQAVPSTVFFGERPLGTRAKSEVAVRLPDGWSVDRIECDQPGTDVTPVPKGGGSENKFPIDQAISASADQSTKFAIVLKAEDGRNERCEVRLVYYGVTGK